MERIDDVLTAMKARPPPRPPSSAVSLAAGGGGGPPPDADSSEFGIFERILTVQEPPGVVDSSQDGPAALQDNGVGLISFEWCNATEEDIFKNALQAQFISPKLGGQKAEALSNRSGEAPPPKKKARKAGRKSGTPKKGRATIPEKKDNHACHTPKVKRKGGADSVDSGKKVGACLPNNPMLELYIIIFRCVMLS